MSENSNDSCGCSCGGLIVITLLALILWRVW